MLLFSPAFYTHHQAKELMYTALEGVLVTVLSLTERAGLKSAHIVVDFLISPFRFVFAASMGSLSSKIYLLLGWKCLLGELVLLKAMEAMLASTMV